MADATTSGNPDIKMDPNNLFREEVFTDRKTGSLKMLTPVDKEGSYDKSREILFVGEAQLMTPMGAMPLAFPIGAKSLGQAAEMFADAAKVAVERAAKELQDLRREAASSIVIPEGMPSGNPGGTGILGSGKIKMP